MKKIKHIAVLTALLSAGAAAAGAPAKSMQEVIEFACAPATAQDAGRAVPAGEKDLRQKRCEAFFNLEVKRAYASGDRDGRCVAAQDIAEDKPEHREWALKVCEGYDDPSRKALRAYSTAPVHK